MSPYLMSDVGMPELDGLEATRQILETVPDSKVLVIKVSEIVLDGFLRTKNQQQPRERPGAWTTPREIEIIRLLAEGKANKEIAAQPSWESRLGQFRHTALELESC